MFSENKQNRWNPDAIVFNSAQMYGTPSYWMQHFFKESSGATLNPTWTLPDLSSQLAASAVTWKSSDHASYLKIKVIIYEIKYLTMI